MARAPVGLGARGYVTPSGEVGFRARFLHGEGSVMYIPILLE